MNELNEHTDGVACDVCGKRVDFTQAKAYQHGLLCSDCYSALDLSEEALLSRKQAAKLLGVSEPTMSRMLMRGDVQAYRVGWHWRIPRSSVLAVIKSNE